MDLEQTYSYFYNMLNSSVNSDSFKAEINQNLFNLLVPFYENILNKSNNGLNQNFNNMMIEKELNSLAIKVNSGKDCRTDQSLTSNSNNRQMDEKHSNYSLNSDQTLKAQNLHKILNRIQSIKGINERSTNRYDIQPTFDNRVSIRILLLVR